MSVEGPWSRWRRLVGAHPRLPTLGRVTALVTVWLLAAGVASLVIFLHSSRSTTLAGHDAEVRPSLDGYATLDLGPYLPSFRYPTGNLFGAHIDLGRTNVDDYETLIKRYAFLASQPQGQIAILGASLADMAVDSVVAGAVVGAAVPGVWLLVGRRRRSELMSLTGFRRTAAAGMALVVGVLAFVEPWSTSPTGPQDRSSWLPVSEVLEGVDVPRPVLPLEVESGLMTTGTKRLVLSALDTYRRSLTFYRGVAAAADGLDAQVRDPADDETVALLVSDRHDNVGMDAVARAIADVGGATFLLDAGDDTSTGGSWEAFSLDSLNEAFADFDRYVVAGNHDNGDFVSTYAEELGFTTLTGEVVDGPDGIRLLGAGDPRSSGLGSWRDEGDVSFDDHSSRLAEVACDHAAQGDRVSTLLVHDADSGQEALDRGCVDLVLAGHLHAQVGPTAVSGTGGAVGYTYSTGTAGGAAYAVAIGSKLRRDAQVTLVTYREGRPVGIQPVTVRTVGDFRVEPYLELEPTAAGEGHTAAPR